jgi:hypothetical protein
VRQFQRSVGGIENDTVRLPERPFHYEYVRHAVPRLGDSCAALRTDRDLETLLERCQMNDQDLLKGAMSRCPRIPLHDHAVEVFSIAVGIAAR